MSREPRYSALLVWQFANAPTVHRITDPEVANLKYRVTQYSEARHIPLILTNDPKALRKTTLTSGVYSLEALMAKTFPTG